MKIFVETQRLRMREILESDAPGFFALDSDPEVHRYLGNRPVKTLLESEAVIRHIRKQYADNGIGRWAVIDKATNDFIGWSGLKYETNARTNTRYYDLGYRLRRKYWGQGIATETAIESLKYGFAQLNIPEISAAAHTENVASNRILIKIGFDLVDAFLLDGERHNWYVLSKSAWEKMGNSY